MAAFYRVPGVVALAVSLGLATGRGDVVILAAPLAIGGVLALAATRSLRGSRAPRAGAAVDAASFGRNMADVFTEVTGADGVELVSVAQPGLDTGPIGDMVTIAGGAQRQTIRTRFRTSSWGRTAVTRPDSLGAGPDGLYIAGPVRYAQARTEVILPAAPAVKPIALPPIIGGWAGAHVSRRPGQGSDLVDLREFAPGDRLRQVHWRAYARHERLYTRRTLSDAEAEFMICLDLSVLFEPRRPTSPSGWLAGTVRRIGTAARVLSDRLAARRDPAAFERRLAERRRRLQSSTDHTVSAAAAFAAAHLRQGDRVGMLTATLPQRLVRPGTGDRQLQRIRHQLALTEHRRLRLLPASLWGLTPGQIVLWCSPMTSEGAFAAVAECVARGHRVIVVDTLPTGALLASATPDGVDHLRILTVERELHLRKLRASGVGVISWDDGNVDGQIIDVARTLRGRR